MKVRVIFGGIIFAVTLGVLSIGVKEFIAINNTPCGRLAETHTPLHEKVCIEKLPDGKLTESDNNIVYSGTFRGHPYTASYIEIPEGIRTGDDLVEHLYADYNSRGIESTAHTFGEVRRPNEIRVLHEAFPPDDTYEINFYFTNKGDSGLYRLNVVGDGNQTTPEEYISLLLKLRHTINLK